MQGGGDRWTQEDSSPGPSAERKGSTPVGEVGGGARGEGKETREDSDQEEASPWLSLEGPLGREQEEGPVGQRDQHVQNGP